MATTFVFKRRKTCPERPSQLRINETGRAFDHDGNKERFITSADNFFFNLIRGRLSFYILYIYLFHFYYFLITFFCKIEFSNQIGYKLILITQKTIKFLFI